ncbi:hypothetical protein C8J57DRAFT_91744 [Mycena rebaudengoi]|nr:hypothetical protein C8J57DRAFT_91744 [Mycena rebaudengoi]
MVNSTCMILPLALQQTYCTAVVRRRGFLTQTYGTPTLISLGLPRRLPRRLNCGAFQSKCWGAQSPIAVLFDLWGATRGSILQSLFPQLGSRRPVLLVVLHSFSFQ